jgi:mannose-6-phosphate isomerase-like protein (cupin superfamily)
MYAEDIKKLTKENTNFRKVLYTGIHSQIVAMNIPVGGDIGEETHAEVDQILYFVDGECEASLNGEVKVVEEHDIVFVPAGTKHNFKNVGDKDLKLFTVYAPPEHPDGTVHATKADAQKAEITS